jgi:hypothetical protein
MTKNKAPLLKQEIIELYAKLKSVDYNDYQGRGYYFEHILSSLIHHEKLEPKLSYRPRGEQIDGSFYWGNQVFLLEAKWEKNAVAASTLYSFKGKLDGKFHTTSGIFFSYNGFSKDAEDALRFGKTINILLYGKDDIEALCKFEIGFAELLKLKLRAAGDTGVLYSSIKDLVKKKDDDSHMDMVSESSKTYGDQGKDEGTIKILVFVENKRDEKIARNLFAAYEKAYNLPIHVIPMDGLDSLARVPVIVNTLAGISSVQGVVLLIDETEESSNQRKRIESISDRFEQSAITFLHKVIYLNKSDKALLSMKSPTFRQIQNRVALQETATFVQHIRTEYYYPLGINIEEIISSRLGELVWERKNKTVWYIETESGMPVELKSIEDLIDYVNDEIVAVFNAEASLEWLRDQDHLDYSATIREYLIDHYIKKIKSIGWNPDEL